MRLPCVRRVPCVRACAGRCHPALQQDESIGPSPMDDGDSNFMHSKKKRKRTAPEQLKVLEDVFNGHQHPNLLLRNQLAVQLGMTPRSVQIWFQNRRAKARNMEFTTSNINSAISALTTSPTSPSTSPPSSIDANNTIEESIYKSVHLSSITTKVLSTPILVL